MHRVIFGIVLVTIISIFIVKFTNESQIDTVHNCKVEKLVQQSIISGDNQSLNTEIRYLVITDRETFICESSTLNGKFNNSDIFWHLKEGQTYTFKVSGMGKTMVTNYRNILKVIN